MFDPISMAAVVGFSLASQSLAARQARKKISDVEFPTADPNRKIPYGAGSFEVSPQVLDWGDFKRSSVRTEFPAWLNFLAPVTAIVDQLPFGYRYYIGMALGLCYGPDVSVTHLKANDRIVWSGNVSGGSFTVEQPGAFGPDGGLYAVVDHVPGSMSQNRNAYWNTLRPNVPSFRGVSCLYWRGPSDSTPPLGKIKYSGYIGRTTIVKEMKVGLTRFPNYLESDFAIINDVHANFAEVIYELLTDRQVGLGLATNLIDDDDFLLAAETLFNEGLGCSFKWEEPTEIGDIIQRLLDTIDGVIYSDLDTGKLRLKLVRTDYDLEDLVLIDETKTGVELELTSSDVSNTVGEVRVPFIDVENNFVEATALAQSLSHQLQQNNTTSVTIDCLGIGDAEAANMVATRDWRTFVNPLARGTLRVNRELYDFHIGQPFLLSWSPFELTQTVFRVLEIDHGTLEDGKISIKIVEDAFATDRGQLGPVVSNQWPDPIVVTPSDDVVRTVKSVSTTAPPGSPDIGDRYIIPAGATGAWSGHTGEIATWNGADWIFEPTDDLEHAVAYNDDDGKYYRWNGSDWVELVTTAYDTIQDEGVEITPRRTTLNFVGDLVSAADDAGDDRTNVTITLPTSAKTAKLLFEFGDGKNSSSIEANQTSRFPDVPAGTITKVRIEGDAAGSAVVDVQTSTADPPSYSSICASAKPTLSSDAFAEDSTLTGWTTAVAAGTKFRAVLQSVSGMTQVSVVLTIVKT